MGKHAQSIDNKIVGRIRAKRPGFVFTPSDFLDLGSRDAIDQALSRHAKLGTIRKLARGLYDYPRRHRKLGPLTPTADTIARALAGRDATRIQPSGAYAANLLGLSDQVPMRIVLLTDGLARNVRLGRQNIILKRTTPKNMATAGKISGLVIQALRHIGRTHVDDTVVSRLRRRLTDQDKRQLLRDTMYAPAWVADVMRSVASGQKT